MILKPELIIELDFSSFYKLCVDIFQFNLVSDKCFKSFRIRENERGESDIFFIFRILYKWTFSSIDSALLIFAYVIKRFLKSFCIRKLYLIEALFFYESLRLYSFRDCSTQTQKNRSLQDDHKNEH